MLFKIQKSTALFLFIFIINIIDLYTLLSQNQKIADSLKNQYFKHTNIDIPLVVLNQIAFHENNPDSNLKYANILMNKAKEQGDTYYQIKASKELGISYRYKGNYDSALYWYFEALNLSIISDDKESEGHAYCSVADVYSESSNHNTAIYYYKHALRNLSGTKDSVSYASVLLNIGGEYMILNEYDTAYHYSKVANQIYQDYNYTTGIAYATGNLGWINSHKSNYRLANEQLHKAISILENEQNYYAVSSYLHRLAKNKLEEADIKSAIKYATKSFNLAISNNFLSNAKEAASTLNKIYEQKGDYKNAYKYQTEFIVLKDSINNLESVRKMADMRTEFEVAQKQSEIDVLSKTKKIQNLIGFGLSIVLFLAMILVVVLHRSSKKHKEFSELLEEQKEELQVKNEQLDELNKTKDRFFSIISHDLRGPIGILNGTTMLIREYLESKDYQQLSELTANMEFSVKKVQGLLDNLLEWAINQQGKYKLNPEQIELNELILEVIDIFQEMANSKEIEISYTCKFNKIYILSDKNSLMTIFRNLISNAIKFTERYGKIMITVIKQVEEIVITVEDNGIGISKSKLNKIFKIDENKSTWGTEREKGLGIGLNLVYEFVRLNKGHIDVESKVGSGTKFIIQLPVLTLVKETNEYPL